MISTRKRLEAATGYLALGLPMEASDELEAIGGTDRLLPEVMAVRSDLYFAVKQWDLLLAVSRELARQRPDLDLGWLRWSFALRQLQRIEEARKVLIEAEPIHGTTCALLHYRHACYACLLGDLATARERLPRACRLDVELKQRALDEPDLKAMWDDFTPDS